MKKIPFNPLKIQIMKFYCLTIFMMLLYTASYSQNENYLITKKGERVEMYENVEGKSIFVGGKWLEDRNFYLAPDNVHFFDEKGKQDSFRHKKIQELHIGGKNYINLPIEKAGFPRLHEVIATNDKYILTQYFKMGYYLYIFDKQTLKPVDVKNLHSRKLKKDQELLNTVVLKYFPNCPELISQIKKNIENADYKNRATTNGDFIELKNFFLDGISGVECH